MSYQYDLQQMQQLMMTGGYNPMRMLGSPHLNPGNMVIMPTSKALENSAAEQCEESDDDEDDEDKRTLFCANLDDKVTEELLFEVFTQAGPIERVRIPKDNNGKQRTFGFITYVHKCTPPYAMQLFKGLSLYRRQLNIKFQGNSKPASVRNAPTAFNNSNKRGNYDNSALRGGGGGGAGRMNESPPMNPFKRSISPDRSGGGMGGNIRDRIGKHASSQSRPHNNSGPYQRRSDGKDDRRDDKRRQQHYNNNNSNRRSDQRNSGGGNYRR